MKPLWIHFIDVDSGKLIRYYYAFYHPAIGDEVRISETLFYKVVSKVWCWDEKEANERLNIGGELLPRGQK